MDGNVMAHRDQRFGFLQNTCIIAKLVPYHHGDSGHKTSKYKHAQPSYRDSGICDQRLNPGPVKDRDDMSK